MVMPSRSAYWYLSKEPFLSTTSAQCISLFFGVLYVGSLYLASKTRISYKTNNGGSLEGTRDDPRIIRARLATVCFSTAVCCLSVSGILFAIVGYRTEDLDIVWEHTLLRLGLPVSFIPSFNPRSLLPHLTVPILFLGPLFGTYLNQQLPLQSNWRWRGRITENFFGLHGLRNYVIGPISEELVFRSCVLAVWQMGGIGTFKMTVFAPLTFGIAHIHHGLETYFRLGRTAKALKHAVLVTSFQLLYTTVFGALVSFLFLRTASVLAPITAHIFCNIMGFPALLDDLRDFPQYRKQIIAAYVIGIIGFALTIKSWTLTEGNLYWPPTEPQFKITQI